MRYARSCQPFRTGLQLVLPEFSSHTRAGTRNRIRLCMPCGKLRVHTKARVSHTQNGRCIHNVAHVHAGAPGRYNTGKVACQTGIICNAAVVVVVGLNYIVTLPGCSSLFHSLSSLSRLFLPPLSFFPFYLFLLFLYVLRVFPSLLSFTAPKVHFMIVLSKAVESSSCFSPLNPLAK